MASLNRQPGSSTAAQRSRLVVCAKRKGIELNELRAMVGGSVSRLSALQASEWISKISGQGLPNPPGQAPRTRWRTQEGVTRMITAEHIEQIDRLLSIVFDGSIEAGVAWLRKYFGVSDPRLLATAARAGEVIRVLKDMSVRKDSNQGSTQGGKPMRLSASPFVFLLMCISAFGQTAADVTKLAALKPLPKAAYWRPADLAEINAGPDRPAAYAHLVRITKTCNIQAETATRDLVAHCVNLCKAHGASIGVWYSPYHRRFLLNVEDPDPWHIGPTYDAELAEFSSKLEAVNIWLQAENTKQSASVVLSAYLLDEERFVARRDDPDHAKNAAIAHKRNAIYQRCKYHTPNAHVQWYGRGVERSAAATGWSPFPWNTFHELADSWSCSLYRVQELEESVETFRRTCALSASPTDRLPVIPWIALGWGQQRQIDRFHVSVLDWRYEKTSLWLLATQINVPWYGWPDQVERFADWSRATFVVLYAAPFDKRTPAWWEYFIVYVRGAHEIKDLS